MSLVIVFALLLAIPSSLLAADARPQRQVDLSQAPGTAQTEWEKTVAAAKKEGQVVINAGPGVTLFPIQAGVFQKKFPKIKSSLRAAIRSSAFSPSAGGREALLHRPGEKICL